MAKIVSFIRNEQGYVINKFPGKVTVEYAESKEFIKEFEVLPFINRLERNQQIDREQNAAKYEKIKLILKGKGFKIEDKNFNPKYRTCTDYAKKNCEEQSIFTAEKNDVIVNVMVNGKCELYVFNDSEFFKELKERVSEDTYSFLRKTFYYIVEERMAADSSSLNDRLDIIEVLQEYIDIDEDTLSVLSTMLEENDFTEHYEEDIHVEDIPISFLAGFRAFVCNNWIEVFAYKKNETIPMDGELNEEDDILSAIESIEDVYERFVAEKAEEERFERFLNTERYKLPDMDYGEFI